jgi:hypothetical protein
MDAMRYENGTEHDTSAIATSGGHRSGSGRRPISGGRGAMVALLSDRRCRPVLTAVIGCNLSREQCLPNPADTRSPIATTEVLAVDAARRRGWHVCQSGSCPA